jgi:hypothetical protein
VSNSVAYDFLDLITKHAGWALRLRRSLEETRPQRRQRTQVQRLAAIESGQPDSGIDVTFVLVTPTVLPKTV